MKDFRLDLQAASGLINTGIREKAYKSWESLMREYTTGGGMLGWVDVPANWQCNDYARLEEVASTFCDCEFVVCIGIGGSYLGARAAIEALSHSFEAYKQNHTHPQILFAGQNICQDYLYELMMLLQDRRFGIMHISKSGTTTEPAIAFRFLRELLISKEGEKRANQLTVAVTSYDRGALRTMVERYGFPSLGIPDKVGGRFSVLTAVGLLPMLTAGINVRELIEGAQSAREWFLQNSYEENLAMQLASARYALYQSGKKIEILATSTPKLHFFSEWWKQLFAESEGKRLQGLFPAAVTLTTDLHSMGQWIQDGERSIFETYLTVAGSKHKLTLPHSAENLDQLNYMAGYTPDEINGQALLGSHMAHTEGGVPVLNIGIPELGPYQIGQLLYFFQAVVAVSGVMLGVNPFDQPGVENYKTNTFRLLHKPGY